MSKILCYFFLSILYFWSNANDLEKLSYKELDSLMEIAHKKSDINACISFMSKGREKAKKEYGIMDSVYTEYTANLGYFYKIVGKYQLAERLYLEASNLNEKVLGDTHPTYAISLNNLGGLYRSMGFNKKAEAYYLLSIKIKAKSLSIYHASYAISLHNLAELYSYLGEYEKAEPLFEKAITVFGKQHGKKHRLYATSINNLAELKKKLGQYNEAESLYLEAIKVNLQIDKNESISMAHTLDHLAGLYKLLGRYKEAETHFLKALKIYGNTLGKNHPNYSTCLNNMALLYEKMKLYKLAETYYSAAIKINIKTLGNEHPSYATNLNNLASIHRFEKRYKKAETLYQEALKIYEKSFGKNHPHYMLCLNNIALLYNDMNQQEDAWRYVFESINQISQANIRPNIDKKWADLLKNCSFYSIRHIEQLVITLTTIYDLLDKDPLSKNHEKQVLVADLAIHLISRIKDGYLTEKDKLRMLSKSNNWLQKILSISDLNIDFIKVFNYVELNKSVLLTEANKTAYAYQLGNLPDMLINQERHLQSKQAELEATLLKKIPKNTKDSIITQLNELNLKIHAFKKRIEKEHPRYAKLKYQANIPKISEIQQTLQPEQALIEYVIGDSSIFVFYIDKHQTRAIQLPIDSAKLNRHIKIFQSIISNYSLANKDHKKSYEIFTLQAHWFYERLLKPILMHAKDKKQLIIIPDGKIGHLPFEVFLVAKNKKPKKNIDYRNLHYLIQNYQISYHYSASLWLDSKDNRSSKNNGQLLAMAADYEVTPTHSKSELRLPTYFRIRNKLNPLPAARQEVASLAQSFNGYFGYDSIASERTFKEKASNYGVIHLAMHGLLNEKFPTLSSLAFTDTHDSTENDFLQAYEISRMELNADLVVLSACQTGYGKFERGNGIASLARAFMYAGVPSLVVSLWQVDDIATAKIMKEFYFGLAKGQSKSEALRQAKLWYIENAPEAMKHPTYWSPFIQIGNSRPIEIQRKYAYTPWYVGVLALFLVAGLIFWKRKQLF